MLVLGLLQQQDATVLCAPGPGPASPPLVVAEPPSYYSRLSSYTQTLSADTLVYFALRVTGRFICVNTYQFAEINGNIRHPASAPCYARSTVLLPSKPPALVLALAFFKLVAPRAREPPARCPLEEQVTPLAAWKRFSPWFSLPVGCVRLDRSRQAGRATQRAHSHIALHRPMCSRAQDLTTNANPTHLLTPGHTHSASCRFLRAHSNPGSSFDRFDICSHQRSPCRSLRQINPSLLAALQ